MLPEPLARAMRSKISAHLCHFYFNAIGQPACCPARPAPSLARESGTDTLSTTRAGGSPSCVTTFIRLYVYTFIHLHFSSFICSIVFMFTKTFVSIVYFVVFFI